MGVHLFGIRHHGPGGARSLGRALARLEPDCVLIEGPPEGDAVLGLAAHASMRPPVALLVYNAARPSIAAHYPFAAFSPEWVAIRHALERGVPARFIDLPQAHQLLDVEPAPGSDPTPEAGSDAGPAAVPDPEPDAAPDAADPHALELRRDPLLHLARAAGHDDGERWWERLVELRRDDEDVFGAVLEAMTALREACGPDPSALEARREAHMRGRIRDAEAAGFGRIAVVCGAWHAPALADGGDPAADAALLSNLPRAEVSATWVPWTHGRLSRESGYGAGVDAPGWYAHLFDHLDDGPVRVASGWAARAARVLRAEGLEASGASAIEAVRLAEALAALRGRPLPGLEELTEAIHSVLCGGQDAPARIVRSHLTVGETLGAVPPETPAVALRRDLEREARRWRLEPDPLDRALDLDLRRDLDLGRSRLLHRLTLLGVPWGERAEGMTNLGTFRETWRLRWRPEFVVRVNEAAALGQTVLEAATGAVRERAAGADLSGLTVLLDASLLADLGGAAADLVGRVESEAAVAADVTLLLGALGPLARILRYGDVRRTDTAALADAVRGIVARATAGLGAACAGLNDEAAASMSGLVHDADAALRALNDAAPLGSWQDALRALLERPDVHGLVGGRAARLLLDAGEMTAGEAARRLGLACSAASPPAHAAAWAEGFLGLGAQVLLHDAALLGALDDWLAGLGPDAFSAVLPALRRTFSAFAAPERRALGERLRRAAAPAAGGADLDDAAAAAALETVARLLGVTR